METKEAEPGKTIAACFHSSPVSDGAGEENSLKKTGDMMLEGPGCQHGYWRTIDNGDELSYKILG